MDNAQRSRTRSNLGFTREKRSLLMADPLVGGSRGYPVWYRLDVLPRGTTWRRSIAAAVDRFKPCKKTIRRWMNGVFPYQLTGGRERENLVSKDLLLMTIFLLAHPDAVDDEIAAYIFNCGG
jgi:hypothetical protein